MIAAAYGLAGLPIIATVIIGLGNAAFHIGGGIDVLNVSSEKLKALGIFVSPGAFGVYFGTIFGRGEQELTLPVVTALTIAAIIIFTARRIWAQLYLDNEPFDPKPVDPTPTGKDNKNSKILIAITCFFLVVTLRSYLGLSIDFTWKGIGYWGLALVCASAFGKAAGGFLADRFGLKKTTTITLGIATVLFILPQIPLAGVTAIFLFNMTMPITLWAMAKVFPKAKGFSFGLLTFALFAGFLPVYLNVLTLPVWMYAPIALLSLSILYLGLRKAHG